MPPPAVPMPQETRWVDQHRVDFDGDKQMGEINVIFGGIMPITSRTQAKKIQCKISLAQRIEAGRMMKWSDVGISFGPEDHLDIELSERNLTFVVKILIGWHKVAKTLIDSGASLNLMMRKTFIKMGLNLAELTPVHDTFHGIILGQSSTPIRHIDLEVSCGMRDNKRMEMLMFEVDNFDIGYNCIIGRPFLLKFMAIIHTTYTTIKMPGPKGVITIESDQCDVLACENAALSHAEWFGAKATEEQAVKVAKTHDVNTQSKSLVPKPPTSGTPRPPSAKKGTHVASGLNQLPTDLQVHDKKKGATNKEVLSNPSDLDKKLYISGNLEAK
jgi:hypothetical protein